MYVNENLQKCIYRHAGENRHPVNNCFDWITHTIPGVRPAGQPAAVQIRSWRICPAFAGMTNKKYSGLSQSFIGKSTRL